MEETEGSKSNTDIATATKAYDIVTVGRANYCSFVMFPLVFLNV